MLFKNLTNIFKNHNKKYFLNRKNPFFTKTTTKINSDFNHFDKKIYNLISNNMLKNWEITQYTSLLYSENKSLDSYISIIQTYKYGFKRLFLKYLTFTLSMLAFFGGFLLVKKWSPYKNSSMLFDDSDFFEEINPHDKKQKLPTFNDVCGIAEVKEELSDIVTYFKNPPKFKEFGIKIPKGILISGYPGCGKTLLARALAGESNVTFISTSGSAFEQMFYGLGALRVRRLFKEAREKAPCIIFIDEIDAIGQKRSIMSTDTLTINQLLTEMDGFKPTDGIVIIGATNIPDVLDPALTRSGRFDRHLSVNLPGKSAREDIIKLNLKGKPINKDVDTSSLASEIYGFSGADISNLINAAATEVIKSNKKMISMKDLREAISIISMGRVRESVHLNNSTKYSIAYHEAGHAIVALFSPHADEVSQMTILPRGMSLGATYLIQKEDSQYSKSKEELSSMIDVCMGGFVAEELVFGKEKVSSGASDDFQRATQYAMNMVTAYGFYESMGKMSIPNKKLKYLGPHLHRLIRKDVKNILDMSYLRAKKIIEENEIAFRNLANAVFLKETLSKKEILEVINK